MRNVLQTTSSVLGTYIKIRIHLFLSKYFAHFKIELLFFAETYNKMIILRLKNALIIIITGIPMEFISHRV